MSIHGSHYLGSQSPSQGDHEGTIPWPSNGDTLPSGEDDPLEQEDFQAQTPIGEDEPDTIATEVIDEIEAAIESFRDGTYSKGTATFHIIQSIEFADTTPNIRHRALDYYIDTLDRIQRQLEEQTRRGNHAAHGLQQERLPRSVTPRSYDDTTQRSNRSPGTSQSLHHYRSPFNSAYSRQSPFGSITDHSDTERKSTGDGDGGSQRKKRKIDVKRLPWYGKETTGRTADNPSTIRTRKILEYFGRDFTEVKRQVELSGSAPIGFPTDQWDNVIKCRAVNLDVILSSLYHVGAPKENVGRIGRTEISLGRSEPVRKVETQGQWLSAFNAYVKAVVFAFEHREHELRDYMEYIEGLFSSRVVAAHPKVILFDKAVREEVGGGQRILLTDTNRFQRLATAILMPDGIEAEGGRRKGKQSADRAICIRYNRKTCPDTANDCRWRHVCRKCGSSGHTQSDCTNNV